MRGTIGHEVLAGAIGGTSVLGGAFTSPLLAPVVDLVSATVTAGIAAHAVHSSGGDDVGIWKRRVLHDVARRSISSGRAPLAAHVIDAACRTRACDTRALRSVATLIGRAFEGHARGIAIGLFGAWCAPLRRTSRVLDAAMAMRAALDNAELVQAAGLAARDAFAASAPRASEPFAHQPFSPFAVPESFESTLDDDAPPASGRFPIAVFAESYEPLEAA